MPHEHEFKVHGPDCVGKEGDIVVTYELSEENAKAIKEIAAERGVCECVIVREALDHLRAELEAERR